MSASIWATQQLAEFLAILAAATDGQAAAEDALATFADSFQADACVFVQGDRVISSIGLLGYDPDVHLFAAANNAQTGIDLPRLGWCETVAIGVDRDAGTTLLLARAAKRFTPEEVGLLRGFARILALGLRLLHAVAVERASVAALLDHQTLLERLAQIQRKISSRESLQEVTDAITSGVAELLGYEMAALQIVDESNGAFMETVSSVGLAGSVSDRRRRFSVAGGISGQAIAENRVCVAETYQDWQGAIAEFAEGGARSAMAAPVHLEGRTAGSLVVVSHRDGATYSQSDRDTLISFAEHASLALNDARTVQARDKALTDATYRAMHDELTGLPNRACFYDRTEQALRHGVRDGTSTAVLLFDLDRFKEINDTLGHRYGDQLLGAIGPRIQRSLRDSDTLARLGGDEFCVLLPRISDLSAAVEVARRIADSLEEPFEIDGMALAVEASCGIAIAPYDGDSADLLLQRSDVAMYVAKGSHINVVTYSTKLNVNSPARLTILGDLRTAIADDQLVLHYQPKADLASRQIQGVEALIRWSHPTLGLVAPDHFIPIAESSGLIKPLTTWVLNTALARLQSWRDQAEVHFPTGLTMAVNVSTRSLLDDGFPSEVAGALVRWKIPSHLLELEITESAIMADPARARRLLGELAAAGVRLSIDDFGTGYSSLAYLKNLPVDQLKIDRSFVLNMHHDPNDAIIVRSVIDLGHNLGLQTVAEGVENLDTWHQLANLKCDSAQGYFLARPLPAAEFANWLGEEAKST